MNKNILKYFGLAALLALGANAEAANVAKIGTTEYETLAKAVAAANDGDTVTIISSEPVSINGVSINKNVTIEGAGADKTVLDMGTGSMGGVASKTVTYRNLTLRYNNTGTMPYTQGVNHAMQAYDHVTIAGSIAVMDDTLFDTCTFTGALDDGTAVPEYLVWIYAHKATFTNCTFEKAGSKGSIKLYAEAGNMCATEVAGTTFKEIGSKGSAIYTSNSNNSSSTAKVVYEVVTDDASITVPEGKVIVKASGNGLSVVNPVKDANGKYIGGQFITASTDQATIESIIGNVCAEGYAPKKNDDGTYGVEVAAKNFYQDETNTKLWHIANAEGLKEFRDSVNVDKKFYAGSTVQLDADIDLQGSAENQWQPITGGWNTAFAGVFDGQGHVIKNLYIYSTTSDCLGFFGYIFYGTVKNVVIENVNLGGNAATGAVVADGVGTVENAHVRGAIHIGVSTEPTWVPGYKASYCGGIVGHGYISVRNCSVKGVSPEESIIAGGRQIGGIIGFESEGGQIVENCTVENVSVLGTYCVGGIQGWVHYGNTLRNCSIKNVVVGCPEGKTASVYSLGYISGYTNEKGNFIFANNTVTDSTCLNSAAAQLEGKYAVSGMRVSYRIGETTYVFAGSSHPETGVKYTLAYAISEAQKVCGESGVYILTNTGTTDPLVIPEGMTVVLDLNGCTVASGNYKDKTITNYGTLTIRNGKIDGVVGNPATLEDTVTIINQVPIAKIGGVEYPSIANAISAVVDDDVITIVNDYDYDTSSCSITGAKRFTIDLNGHEIRGKSSYVFTVSGSTACDVTICDNSEAKSGKVVNTSQSSTAAAIRTGNKFAKLTILDGEFVCEQGIALYDYSGCNITVLGGAFKGTVALDGYDKGPITLAGGVFEGSEYAVKVRYKTTEVLISDGTYRGGLTQTAGKLSIEGGTFDVDPTTYVVEGKGVIDNKDGTWTVGAVNPETKVVVPDESEIKPVDEKGQEITGADAEKAVEAAKTAVEAIAGNKGAEMTEGTGVEAAVFTSGEEVKAEVAQGLNDQAKNVTKDDKGTELSQPEQQEVQEKVAAVSTSKDLSSYVKVDVKSPVVEVKESVATVKTLVYDVQPMAVTKVTTTVDSANPKTVTVEAPVEYNDAAKPITFRLPLTDAFTVSAIVTHEGDPDRLCMVQGAAGGRYVEVTASHFSLFTATPSEIIETTTESKTVLGIKRVDYTVTQSTADLAAAVPWLMAAEENMPVSGLITTGLSAGDQIQVYEKSANAYYTWLYRDGEWEGAPGTGTPSADEYKLERGRAFWYKPAANKIGVTGTYTQVGLYSEAAITSKVDSAAVESASFAKPVHFLMASPKYEDFNLKEKLTYAAGCRANDVVVIVATGARYRFNGEVWGQDIDQKVTKFGVTVTQKVFEATEGAISVPAGTAFWYLSAGGAPEFEW